METKDINNLMASNFLSVQVRVDTWGATVSDAALSTELTQAKGAVSGAAKVTKSLMAGAAHEYKQAKAAYDSVRTFVYERTLPYVTGNSDGARKGPRLLPTVNSLEFLKDYTAMTKDAESKLNDLCAVYTQRMAEALRCQGALTDASQYPDVDEVRRKFSISLTVLPVPDTADFSRGMIPPAIAEALGSRLAQQQSSAMSIAMDDMKLRLLKETRRIAEQLGKAGREESTRLYDSLIGNIRQITGLLKASYIGDNEEVTDLITRIETELCPHNTEVYKNNPNLAKQTAKQAEDISKLIDGISFF